VIIFLFYGSTCNKHPFLINGYLLEDSDMRNINEDIERIITLIEHSRSYNSKTTDGIQNILNERKVTMTYDEFVDKAKKIHRDKYEGYYDYQNEENWRGIKNTDSIKLFCNETPPDFPAHPHGEFEVSPRKHIDIPRGCDVCTGRRNTKYTWLQKIKDKKLHQDTEGNFIYKYDKVPFNIEDKDIVTIWCPIHGDFSQIVQNHSNGSGCQKCAQDKNKDTKEIWIEKIKESPYHKNKQGELIYNYDDVDYKTNKIDVIINCPKHGPFPQSPSSHLRGSGCPTCRESKGEKMIRKYLEGIDINIVPQKKFEFCVGHPSSKGECHQLPYDFYLPDYKILIEVDGRQHFEPVRSLKSFEKQRAYDLIKNEFVSEKFPDIKYLIRLDYSIQKPTSKDIEKMVNDFKDIFEIISRETSSEEIPYKKSYFKKVILSKGYPKKGWNDPNILKQYQETKSSS